MKNFVKICKLLIMCHSKTYEVSFLSCFAANKANIVMTERMMTERKLQAIDKKGFCFRKSWQIFRRKRVFSKDFRRERRSLIRLVAANFFMHSKIWALWWRVTFSTFDWTSIFTYLSGKFHFFITLSDSGQPSDDNLLQNILFKELLNNFLNYFINICL